MTHKTGGQADIDEMLKTRAVSALKAKGLSLNTVLEMAAANDRRLIDMLIKKKEAEMDDPLADTSTPSKAKKHIDLKTLPAFGMWSDRTDMENPVEWVRNLRKSRFQNDF